MSTLRRSLLPCLIACLCCPVRAQRPGNDESPNALSVTAGKSVIVTSQQPIERVAVGFGEVAEATVVSPLEVLVNGKGPGSTSLIVWEQGGGKLFFDVNVRPARFLSDTRLEGVRREVRKELPGQNITLTADGDQFYLRGTAKDLTSADRAMAIASSLGKVLNLLYVEAPTPAQQILLRVRFASLDRSRGTQFGFNLFSTGAANTIGSTGTQQFPGPTLPVNPQSNNLTNPFVFSDLLNIFLFRKDINLGAVIKDLEVRGILQTLAEPNVLAENGRQASFLAGGEFPYPVLQSSTGGVGAITIQFREFGVRLNFIPTITARGTIRLQVAPEVSALDFANGLTIQGLNIPALTTRKVNTEVELDEGQTFAIGGLLDRRVSETLEKMPIIGNIPILGKLFQSRNVNRQNTELVVMVTPELVRPIAAGAPVPDIKFPRPFLDSENAAAVRTPGIDKTGPVPPRPHDAIPFEKLVESMQPEKVLNVGSTTSVFTNAPAMQQQDTAAPRNPVQQSPAPSAGPPVPPPQ